jgi:enoyl-CoA hydratase/carnithine racemase
LHVNHHLLSLIIHRIQTDLFFTVSDYAMTAMMLQRQSILNAIVSTSCRMPRLRLLATARPGFELTTPMAPGRWMSSSSSQPQHHILMETLYSTTESDPDTAAISKLTLNRPKANAMGSEMIQRLQDCLEVLEDPLQTKSRCLVLTSFSQKVFSAGADLKERATMTQEEAADFVTLLRNTMERVARLPFPVIAAVEGVAVGGGFELALAADLRIASSSAQFGLPETSLAIVPGAGGTQRLPRLIGVARAKELIWTGRKLDGEEAFRYGIVQEVVSPGEATDRAVSLGFQIAANGPIAIRASKESIDRGLECTNMRDALEVERQCYAKVLPTQDRLEGLAAFKEGRKPKYSGQ